MAIKRITLQDKLQDGASGILTHIIINKRLAQAGYYSILGERLLTLFKG